MTEKQKFEYRCVAGPTVIAVKKPADRAKAVAEYQNIINREAAEGWEFICIDEFETSEPPGCLQGNKPILTVFKMLVFKRAKG